jgi:hypothetical protein
MPSPQGGTCLWKIAGIPNLVEGGDRMATSKRGQMGLVGFPGFVAAVSGFVLVATAGGVRAESGCPSVPPMPTLELRPMYSDARSDRS